jgi:hypothetical protein
MLFCILELSNFAPQIKALFMDSIISDTSILGIGKKLISKKQAAAEFGIHYRTLERWYNFGYISYIRLGGRVFVSLAEILRIRDQFADAKPNGNYIESRICTIDDIHRRQRQSMQGQYYGSGARR